ncbi:unnamed protein product [Bemisia tabaci]|uniref:Sodium-coupled monocarboxylate transporter 1 n=1 Tax=Bemisia tabaci TaxID=7038 RepID=A0A9P0F3U4_BEMTA|nr:unnamed protein product [Bemisia tabaci]
MTMETVPGAEAQPQFVVADYLVFGGMLTCSMLIGVYHGCGLFRKEKKKVTSDEFLTAEGKLGTIPVALSMLASFLSSITLMGQPAEVYQYGPQLWMFGASAFLVVPFIGYRMVPFFLSHKYTSAYQYFGERFSKKLQLLTSVLFSFQMILYLALVLYAPALAMHRVTGMNTMLVVTTMYLVCIFYTTIGGMKAVVWTDSFQIVVLYVAMIAILVKGTIDIGGLSTVWERNAEFNRTNFLDWTFDPTVRYDAWSSFVGSAVLHVTFYGGNQLQIQRYFVVNSAAKARKMLWINAVGWTCVVFLTVYTGMLIFANYAYCDPIKSHVVSTPDELFPLYVMQTLNEFPGFPGLFLAGIFSAGLSTVATGVNSLAAIWFAEMEGTKFRAGIDEKHSGTVVKLLAFCFGILSYLLVFVVPYMGTLAKVTISLSGAFAGSLFGIFVLGLCFPRVETWGATIGLVSSTIFMAWVTVGSMAAERLGDSSFQTIATSVVDCPDNSTLISVPEKLIMEGSYEIPYLHRVSYLWYATMSISVTVAVGITVSYTLQALGLAAIPQKRIDRIKNGNSNLHPNPNNQDQLLLDENSRKLPQIVNEKVKPMTTESRFNNWYRAVKKSGGRGFNNAS